MTSFARSLTAITAVVAASISLSTPASAAVDISVKHAIVSVVLENLGVQASDELIAEIAGEIDPTDLSTGLYASVAGLLDAGADPRATIEGATDANGDGVPEAGAALKSPNSNANVNATEKDDNSDDKSTNSSGRSPTGTVNSSSGGSSGGVSSSTSGKSGSSSNNSNNGSDGDEPDDEGEDDD